MHPHLRPCPPPPRRPPRPHTCPPRPPLLTLAAGRLPSGRGGSRVRNTTPHHTAHHNTAHHDTTRHDAFCGACKSTHRARAYLSLAAPAPRPVSFRHHYHHPPARAHAVEEGDGRHTHGCGRARAFGVVGGGDRRVGAVGVWARPAPAPPGNDAPGRHHGGGKRGWVEGKRKEKGGVDPNTPDPRK